MLFKDFFLQKPFKMMPETKLPKSKLVVSKLCFGTGQLNNLSISDGGNLLIKAYESGINFWDTSDDYGTIPHVAKALQKIPRHDIVLMSKITNIFYKNDVLPHLTKMCHNLGTNYLDVLFLHGVDTVEKFSAYSNIIDKIMNSGMVGHLGFSTHVPLMAEFSYEDPRIEILMVPWNYEGLRIQSYKDETQSKKDLKLDMEAVLKTNNENKDIILMKILGGGKIPDYNKAILEALNQDFANAINIGMENISELQENIGVVSKWELNQRLNPDRFTDPESNIDPIST